MGEIRPLHLEMGARDRNGLEIQREKRKNRSSESVRNGWLGCECSEHQLIRGSLNGNLIVLSGSIARATEAPTVPKGAKKLREQLQNDGVLTSVESGLLFVTDRQFDSPSMAAGVVSGTSVSGRKASWRLSDGMTYGEWDAAKNASLPVDGNGVMQAELPIAMIEE